MKAWYSDKGYGFLINGSPGSKDILVHSSELKNCEFLKAGREVDFDCDCNEKGLVAKNVFLVYEVNAQIPAKEYSRAYPVASTRVHTPDSHQYHRDAQILYGQQHQQKRETR